MLPAVNSVMPPRKPGIFYEPYHTAPCVNRFFFSFHPTSEFGDGNIKEKKTSPIAAIPHIPSSLISLQRVTSHQYPRSTVRGSAADQESRIQGREPVREKAYLVL